MGMTFDLSRLSLSSSKRGKHRRSTYCPSKQEGTNHTSCTPPFAPPSMSQSSYLFFFWRSKAPSRNWLTSSIELPDLRRLTFTSDEVVRRLVENSFPFKSPLIFFVLFTFTFSFQPPVQNLYFRKMDSVKETIKSATGNDAQSKSQFEKGMISLPENPRDTPNITSHFIISLSRSNSEIQAMKFPSPTSQPRANSTKWLAQTRSTISCQPMKEATSFTKQLVSSRERKP